MTLLKRVMGGTPYIIIGGVAMAHYSHRATDDEDALVIFIDKTLEELKTHREVTEIYLSPAGRILDGYVRGVRFDILSSELFCGSLTPEAFFQFAVEHHTFEFDGELVATPPLVIYLRLVNVGWSSSLGKLREDAHAVPSDVFSEWLKMTVEIAKTTGYEKVVMERVRQLKDNLL